MEIGLLMPRYFFHVTQDDPQKTDTVGLLLPDRKAAWAEAIAAWGDMLKDLDGNLSIDNEWKMEVQDEEGPVFSIRFVTQTFD